jgi:hypothetical protein
VMADTVGRLEWQRSSYCDSSNCVEVALMIHRVTVRDGKDPEGPRLIFTVEEWTSFVDWLRRCGA